ncbi:MAG: MBOAT family protein [Oscillospiraceae bacterium]|nr:MBOAT family protein [Oscillospiraceae bacterium]
MLFSSISFLYFFLPIVLILYFAVPKNWKNHVLLISSLLFYFFGEPIYVTLLIFSSVSDFFHSLYIEKHRGTKGAKIALISSIVINLGMLGFFKYADFFLGTINGLLGTNIPLFGVELPIGISFFTFQTMSYTIDVYRGEAKADRNLATFGTFVCLFPQLIAGPIVRYTDISRELHSREIRREDIYCGIRRFILGLGKKILIANTLAEFGAQFHKAEVSVVFYWLYAVAFSLQIYFDFSGYSDMAIGLGRIFGFRFPENFNYPFISKSISEFWRRWHMTMGGWFRDYVYIPLGGNRCSKGRWLFNTAVVWAVTGLWHGASWNFVLWGLYFAVLMILEKVFLQKYLNKLGVLRHLYTMFLIVISFVIFNANDLAGVWTDLRGLFGAAPLWTKDTGYYLQNYAMVFAIGIIGCTPLCKNLWKKISSRFRLLDTIAEPVYMVLLLVAVTSCLISGSLNPFLYFRF